MSIPVKIKCPDCGHITTITVADDKEKNGLKYLNPWQFPKCKQASCPTNQGKERKQKWTIVY